MRGCYFRQGGQEEFSDKMTSEQRPNWSEEDMQISREESSRKREKPSAKALRQALCLTYLRNSEVWRYDKQWVRESGERWGQRGKRWGEIMQGLPLQAEVRTRSYSLILECWNNKFLESWHLDSQDMQVAGSESVKIPSCQNHCAVGQRMLDKDHKSPGLKDLEDQTRHFQLGTLAPQS